MTRPVEESSPSKYVKEYIGKINNTSINLLF